MALILIEGFSDDSAANWDAGTEISSISTSSVRVPGGYRGSISALTKSFTAASYVVLGVGLYPNYAQPRYISFYGDSGTTKHITVTRNTTTRFLEIRRGADNGTILATGTTAVADEAWSYIEISATISDTIGEVHVRLNGLSTDEVSYTGDTKNGGTNDTIDKVYLRAESINCYMSDIYLLDGTGSANNTFLGDVAVRVLHPSGNGNSSQLTGSDADQADNYLHVDESPFSETDYTSSSTTGDKDTYVMEDLPANTAEVLGVRLTGSMQKADAGIAQSRLLLRSGSTDYGADTEVLSTSAQQYSKLYEQDPATATAWTVSGVNSAEAGMEVM